MERTESQIAGLQVRMADMATDVDKAQANALEEEAALERKAMLVLEVSLLENEKHEQLGAIIWTHCKPVYMIIIDQFTKKNIRFT